MRREDAQRPRAAEPRPPRGDPRRARSRRAPPASTDSAELPISWKFVRASSAEAVASSKRPCSTSSCARQRSSPRARGCRPCRRESTKTMKRISASAGSLSARRCARSQTLRASSSLRPTRTASSRAALACFSTARRSPVHQPIVASIMCASLSRARSSLGSSTRIASSASSREVLVRVVLERHPHEHQEGLPLERAHARLVRVDSYAGELDAGRLEVREAERRERSGRGTAGGAGRARAQSSRGAGAGAPSRMPRAGASGHAGIEVAGVFQPLPADRPHPVRGARALPPSPCPPGDRHR